MSSKPPIVDRKSLKQPDTFVSRGRRVLGFLAAHRTRFATVAGIAVAAAAIFYAFEWWSTRQSDAAWVAYFEAQRQPEDKRLAAFEAVYASHSGTRAAQLAAVSLGDRAFEQARSQALKPTPEGGKPDAAEKAIEWYGKALDYGDLQPIERQLLLINRGKSKELAGKLDEALEDFQQGAALEGPAKGLASLSVGRIWELKGESEKAREQYEKVASEFLDTEYARLAKAYLRALKSPILQEALKQS